MLKFPKEEKYMAGMRKRVFGKMLVVNLNAKKGYRISPGVNARARSIQQCAKGKPLESRKNCFKTGSRRGGKKTE